MIIDILKLIDFLKTWDVLIYLYDFPSLKSVAGYVLE